MLHAYIMLGIMAAMQFWAPLYLLVLLASFKFKWCMDPGLIRTNHVVNLVEYQAFLWPKSWKVCYSFRQRGLSQLTMILLLGGDIN